MIIIIILIIIIIIKMIIIIIRHDRVATAVHWSLARKYGFPHCDQWYQHVAEPVLENANTKLLWDFNIYTDHVIEARRPDIVVVRKDVSGCLMVDIAVSAM